MADSKSAMNELLKDVEIGHFYEPLIQLGIESVEELLDEGLITKDELENRIGMTFVHVRKLRRRLQADPTPATPVPDPAPAAAAPAPAAAAPVPEPAPAPAAPAPVPEPAPAAAAPAPAPATPIPDPAPAAAAPPAATVTPASMPRLSASMRAELRKPIKSSPELRQVIARFEDDVAEAARDAKRQRTDDEETITLRFEENQLSQSDLVALAASALGRHLQHLHIRPEYEDVKPHILDFDGISFPQLKSLELDSQAIRALHFTAAYTPLLEVIDIEAPCAVSVCYVRLDLPLLKTLWLKRVTLSCSDWFGDSISRCPRLECLGGYKIWGLATTKSKPLRLVCPAIKHICFWRADDLNYLKIWAPKLEELDLTGAFDIDTVQLMIRRPKDFSGPEYEVF
ncbi:hypothetical protein JL720_2491 [Aureococcus anophagefferens]|nr:hypothetical protein JL720_2491 [Aureococcus anophagefferens]